MPHRRVQSSSSVELDAAPLPVMPPSRRPSVRAIRLSPQHAILELPFDPAEASPLAMSPSTERPARQLSTKRKGLGARFAATLRQSMTASDMHMAGYSTAVAIEAPVPLPSDTLWSSQAPQWPDGGNKSRLYTVTSTRSTPQRRHAGTPAPPLLRRSSLGVTNETLGKLSSPVPARVASVAPLLVPRDGGNALPRSCSSSSLASDGSLLRRPSWYSQQCTTASHTPPSSPGERKVSLPKSGSPHEVVRPSSQTIGRALASAPVAKAHPLRSSTAPTDSIEYRSARPRSRSSIEWREIAWLETPVPRVSASPLLSRSPSQLFDSEATPQPSPLEKGAEMEMLCEQSLADRSIFAQPAARTCELQGRALSSDSLRWTQHESVRQRRTLSLEQLNLTIDTGRKRSEPSSDPGHGMHGSSLSRSTSRSQSSSGKHRGTSEPVTPVLSETTATLRFVITSTAELAARAALAPLASARPGVSASSEPSHQKQRRRSASVSRSKRGKDDFVVRSLDDSRTWAVRLGHAVSRGLLIGLGLGWLPLAAATKMALLRGAQDGEPALRSTPSRRARHTWEISTAKTSAAATVSVTTLARSDAWGQRFAFTAGARDGKGGPDSARRYEWVGAHTMKLLDKGAAAGGRAPRERVVAVFRRDVKQAQGGGELEVESRFPDIEMLLHTLVCVMQWHVHHVASMSG